MEILSKNLKRIVDTETGGNVHRFSNEYLKEERSEKLRSWIKGVKDPNLNEIYKLIKAVKEVNGKEINLNWLVSDRGEMYVDYDALLEENRIIKKEMEDIKEEYGKFKKMALSNFHEVYTTNQSGMDMLVDNIDELDGLDVVTRNAFLGQSYYSDIIGEA